MKSSHLRLGKCLLISAKMPGCFLIRILHYTAVAQPLIIEEESCGYLMLCCRAFFPVHFSCSAFIPLCSSASPSCCILYCVVRHPHLFFAFLKKKQELLLRGSAAKSQHESVCVCVLEDVLPFHASGDFTALSSENRIPCTLIPPCLHY